MELLFLFIGLPALLGILIAFGVSAIAFIGIAIATVVLLVFRFWYITLAIMAILLIPVIVLEPWVRSVFALLAAFAIVLAFIPIDDKRKNQTK